MTHTSELTDFEQAVDECYNENLLAIKSDANFKQLPGHRLARKLLNVCDQHSIAKLGKTDIIILNGRRIVVPKGARPSIIQELHMTKAFKTARQLYFWPNRKEEIRKAIIGCQFC